MGYSFVIKEAEGTDINISETVNNDFGGNTEQYVPLEENDIIAQLDSEEYSTGTRSVALTLTYAGDNSAAHYVVGREYSLEKWDNSLGDWRSVAFAENAAFTEEGYEISADVECTISLGIGEHMFAEALTAGTYRITKPLCDGVNALLVFELKDVDADSGLVIEQASGSISLCISEMRDGKLICSLPFPSPLVYEVSCAPELYEGFGVGDCIRVSYAPLYRVDEMNYALTALSVEADENDYSADGLTPVFHGIIE